MSYIGSFINYPGGKRRLLPQLLPLFPSTDITSFIDLFTGSSVVSLNVPYHIPIVANDINSQLVSMLKEISQQDFPHFINDIYMIISKYDLSDTYKLGYSFYGVDSSAGLADINREAFNRLRSDFNSQETSSLSRVAVLYLLIVYGFNNQLRFNRKGYFNNPVGKRDFNRSMRAKLEEFIFTSKAKNIHYTNRDFRDIEVSGKSTFVYADPPYLLSTAVYNEASGWSRENEMDLYSYLDNVDRMGSLFALSNVVTLKGRTNTMLKGWAQRYNVHHLTMSYANSSYNTISEGCTDEVLITNY